MAVSPAPMIVAAAVGRARRRIAAHFDAHHAFSAEEAVAFVPDRHLARRVFDRMQRRGIVHEAAPGKYWLDAEAYRADHARRHKLLAIVIAAAAIAIAVALTFGYRG